jgi:hypothetical protein
LRRVAPRQTVLLFTVKKKAVLLKQADLRDMFRKASKSVCTSTIVVYPDYLSPTPSTYLAMKTPENTEHKPITHNQQMK